MSPLRLVGTKQTVVADCRQFETLESGKVQGLVLQRTVPSADRADRILFYELDVRSPDPTLKALWLSLEMTSASTDPMKLVKSHSM